MDSIDEMYDVLLLAKMQEHDVSEELKKFKEVFNHIEIIRKEYQEQINQLKEMMGIE